MTCYTPDDWEPNAKHLLDLKHMGVQQAALDEALVLYRSIEPAPSSEDFLKFAYSTLVTPSASLRLGWEPSAGTAQELKVLGYTIDALRLAAGEFALMASRSGDVLVNPDAAFKSWVQKVYPLNREGTISKAGALHLRACGIGPKALGRAIRFIEDYTREQAASLTEAELIKLIISIR